MGKLISFEDRILNLNRKNLPKKYFSLEDINFYETEDDIYLGRELGSYENKKKLLLLFYNDDHYDFDLKLGLGEKLERYYQPKLNYSNFLYDLVFFNFPKVGEIGKSISKDSGISTLVHNEGLSMKYNWYNWNKNGKLRNDIDDLQIPYGVSLLHESFCFFLQDLFKFHIEYDL